MGNRTLDGHLLNRIGFVQTFLLGVFWDVLPAEGEAPVEVASVVGASVGHRLMETERVHVDGCYLWTDHRCGLLHYAGQQGLQPAVETLTYGDGKKVRSPSGSHMAAPSTAWREQGRSRQIIKATNIQFGQGLFLFPFYFETYNITSSGL